MLRNLLLRIALVAIILASSHAFTSPSLRISTTTTSLVSSTAVGLFGFNNNGNKNEKATTAKGGSKSKPKEEEPKKPFIFLYGRPQYDWVTGKPMVKKTKAEFAWYTKPKPTTPPKK